MASKDSIAYTSPSGFNYSYVLSLEKDYLNNNYRSAKMNWMKQNWQYVFLISFAYLITIFTTKNLMKNRKAYELKLVLVLWNASLAIYSILGATRCLPEFIYILTEKGFKYSVCTETYSYGVTGYWSWLFILSKVYELFDTLLLVLRKREVIFLHWYHHLTVLIYVWYTMLEFPATGRWFATINYSIHAVMYTYYTIVATKIIFVPKFISMFITSAQLIQMVIGVYVNIKAYSVKQNGEFCEVSYENIYLSLLMYASYFYLFFKFFYDKYINSNKNTRNGDVENKKRK